MPRSLVKPEDWDSYRKIRSAVNKHLAERKNAHISNILKASLENNNTKPLDELTLG